MALSTQWDRFLTPNPTITFFRPPVSYYDSKTQEEADEATANYLESNSAWTRDESLFWIRDYRNMTNMNAEAEQKDDDLYYDSYERFTMGDLPQAEWNDIRQAIQSRRNNRDQIIGLLWSRLPPVITHSSIVNSLRFGRRGGWRPWTNFAMEPIAHTFPFLS